MLEKEVGTPPVEFPRQNAGTPPLPLSLSRALLWLWTAPLEPSPARSVI